MTPVICLQLGNAANKNMKIKQGWVNPFFYSLGEKVRNDVETNND
jgi:hypothetical protein